MDTKTIIGTHLKDLRLSQQLTQEELSQLADIDTRHYQRLENGEKLASLTLLFKLSTALRISPDELISPAWKNYKSSLVKNSI